MIGLGGIDLLGNSVSHFAYDIFEVLIKYLKSESEVVAQSCPTLCDPMDYI